MGKTNWTLLSLLLFVAWDICNAHKILFVSPLPGTSHGILGEGIAKNLLKAGHEVTYITAFPKNSTNPKLHEIDVSSLSVMFQAVEELMNLKSILDKKVDNSNQVVNFFVFHSMATSTLEHENVQKLLRDPNQHFDLVIAEWIFNEMYSGLGAVYNAPLIWFSTMEPHWMILNLVDDYTNPSYNGYYVGSGLPFSFLERLSELWFTIKMTVVRETIGLYLQTTAYNKILAPLIELRGKVAPSFGEVRYNASLVLGNSHLSTGEAMRLPQSYKAIGGYHIEDTIKPLPEDLQKIFNKAEHGVIYFSMGSNLKSKHLPDELKRKILELFSTLKQTVLWKFEEYFPDLPKNVNVVKWAPQQSILTHPNCILFITHGGLLSITETIFAGKPIIGIPVFADQFINVARAVSKGFAKKVDLSYNLADDLKIAINEILGDSRYVKRAKELSFVYHDRPVKPGVELVHWAEHVIKTGGAPHLRSPALLVPWYQKMYLDLIIIIFVILMPIFIAIKRLKTILRKKSLDIKKNE